MSKLRHISNSRLVLRIMYYTWVAFPYPIRKPLTAAFLIFVLTMKKLAGVNRNNKPTPQEDLGNLSFWGVPRIAPDNFILAVDGKVNRPLSLSLDDLRDYPVVDRQVTMDCVGGLQNVIAARGVSLAALLERAEAMPDAATAIFHCADGYFTTHPVKDLIESEAYMAYAINGQEIPAHGYPLRLVCPGKYGYKWAKWVVRIELAPGSPVGYWEQRGLPDRAWVGDLS